METAVVGWLMELREEWQPIEWNCLSHSQQAALAELIQRGLAEGQLRTTVTDKNSAATLAVVATASGPWNASDAKAAIHAAFPPEWRSGDTVAIGHQMRMGEFHAVRLTRAGANAHRRLSEGINDPVETEFLLRRGVARLLRCRFRFVVTSREWSPGSEKPPVNAETSSDSWDKSKCPNLVPIPADHEWAGLFRKLRQECGDQPGGRGKNRGISEICREFLKGNVSRFAAAKKAAERNRQYWDSSRSWDK